jgi:hypothetical protein
MSATETRFNVMENQATDLLDVKYWICSAIMDLRDQWWGFIVRTFYADIETRFQLIPRLGHFNLERRSIQP